MSWSAWRNAHDQDPPRVAQILPPFSNGPTRTGTGGLVMLVDPTELVSAADAADLLGVNTNVLSNYQRRHVDFPEPVAIFARGYTALWLRSDILAWRESYYQQRLDRLKEREDAARTKAAQIAKKRRATQRRHKPTGVQ